MAMPERLREAYAWIRMEKRVDAKPIRERGEVTAKSP
jgi:hypothetical protein